MKRILIASALALATAAPAFAADLPPAAAPPPRAPVAYIPAAPVFSWTGFYVGLNAGGAFGNSSWTTPAGSVGSFSTLGALAGGQIGGNYQIGQFVIGAEGDFDWQNLRGASASRHLRPRRDRRLRRRQQLDRHAPWSRRLCRRPRCCSMSPAAAPSLTSSPRPGHCLIGGGTEPGWTAGGGIEYAMTDNWTAKVEYLYASFQSATCNSRSCSVGNPRRPHGLAPATVSFNENIVRAGIEL